MIRVALVLLAVAAIAVDWTPGPPCETEPAIERAWIRPYGGEWEEVGLAEYVVLPCDVYRLVVLLDYRCFVDSHGPRNYQVLAPGHERWEGPDGIYHRLWAPDGRWILEAGVYLEFRTMVTRDCFERCASGPGIPASPDCEAVDYDRDGDVDQDDYGMWQRSK